MQRMCQHPDIFLLHREFSSLVVFWMISQKAHADCGGNKVTFSLPSSDKKMYDTTTNSSDNNVLLLRLFQWLLFTTTDAFFRSTTRFTPICYLFKYFTRKFERWWSDVANISFSLFLDNKPTFILYNHWQLLQVLVRCFNLESHLKYKTI